MDQESGDRIVFEALWSGVINDFEREERHAKFIDFAHKNDCLLEAATRYGALRDDPERGASARKRLGAIALLATHVMLATKSTPRRRPPAWLYLACAIVCVLLLGFATMAYRGR